MSLGTRSLINLDLFTDAYRVTGSTTVGAGGINAELANPNSSFLEIQGAYISRINQPGEIVAHYNLAAFRKKNINFIVLQDRRVGIPVGTQHGRSIYTRGQEIPVFLTVPSFEINGAITHTGKPNPRDILAKAVGGYLLVFSASASASLYPKIAYSGDLIMVSRDRIGLFCLDSNKS